MSSIASPYHEAKLPDQVVEVIAAIEVDIIRSRILPRTRLIEDHLMEDYAAKRHVVRAALIELQRLGVVVKPLYRGAELRRFDADDLAGLYAMRVLLHRSAMQSVRLPVPATLLQEVEAALAANVTAAGTGDLIAIHYSNMAFHRVFFGLCDNNYLAESIRLHDWLSFPVRAFASADPDALKQATREHAAMLSALKKQDRESLERLGVTHMDRARRIYSERFLNARMNGTRRVGPRGSV